MFYSSLKKKIIIILIITIALISAYLMYIVMQRQNTLDTLEIKEENYINAIQAINSKLPIMLDKETRLESIFLEQKYIIYRYRLLHKIKQEIDSVELSKKLKAEILKTYCANNDIMVIFRDGGYHAQYIYEDKNSAQILSVRISPKDCIQK